MIFPVVQVLVRSQRLITQAMTTFNIWPTYFIPCGCGGNRTPDLVVSGYLMLRTFKFSHSIQTVFTEPVTVYSHLLYRLSYASNLSILVAMGRVELPYGPYESPVLPLDYIAMEDKTGLEPASLVLLALLAGTTPAHLPSEKK